MGDLATVKRAEMVFADGYSPTPAHILKDKIKAFIAEKGWGDCDETVFSDVEERWLDGKAINFMSARLYWFEPSCVEPVEGL
jgi:hypothetical protein